MRLPDATPDDLGAPIELRWAEDAERRLHWIGACQDLGAVKYGAQIPVSAELLEDVADPDIVTGILLAQIDRLFRPWRYPDRNPFPEIVLFPRLERLQLWATGLRMRLRRHPLEEDDW